METIRKDTTERAHGDGAGLDRIPSALAWRIVTMTARGVLLGGLLAAPFGLATGRNLGGLCLGALLGVGLLATLHWEVTSLLQRAAPTARFGVFGFLLLLKYPAVGLLLYPLFEWNLVDPRGLVLGFILVQLVLVISLLLWLGSSNESVSSRGEALS